MKKYVLLLLLMTFAAACSSNSGSNSTPTPFSDFPTDLSLDTTRGSTPLTADQQSAFTQDWAIMDVLNAPSDAMPQQSALIPGLSSGTSSPSSSSLISQNRRDLDTRMQENCTVTAPSVSFPSMSGDNVYAGYTTTTSGQGSINGVDCPIAYSTDISMTLTLQDVDQANKIVHATFTGTGDEGLNFINQDQAGSTLWGFNSDKTAMDFSGRMAIYGNDARVEVKLDKTESIAKNDGTPIKRSYDMDIIVGTDSSGNAQLVTVTYITVQSPTYTAVLSLKMKGNPESSEPTTWEGYLNGQRLSDTDVATYFLSGTAAGAGAGGSSFQKR